MEFYQEFLAKIDNIENRERTADVLYWVHETFPQLIPEFKWNQPMFTLNGTFIIGFSVSKKHLAVAPERVVVMQFSEKIKAAGYNHTKMLIQFPWKKQINYILLKEMIAFNIKDKVGSTTFWRRNDE